LLAASLILQMPRSAPRTASRYPPLPALRVAVRIKKRVIPPNPYENPPNP
jgi:hypothetical protein